MVTRKRERVKAVVVARKARGVVGGLNSSKYSADIAEKEEMKLLNLFDLRRKVKGEEKKDSIKKDNLFKEEGHSIDNSDKDEETDDAERTGNVNELISSDLTPEQSELEDRDFSEDFESGRKKHSNRQEDNKYNHENKEKLLNKVGKKSRTRSLSARLLELAEPKPLPSEVMKDMKYEPFTIRKAALKYRASRRIKQLAQPVVRGNVEKKDAFKVKRASLRAICSERIKKLAEAKRAKTPEPNLFKRVKVGVTPPNKPVIRKRAPRSQSSNSLPSKRTKRRVKLRKGQVADKIKKQPDLETNSSSQSDDERFEGRQDSRIDGSMGKKVFKANLSESNKHANKINQSHLKKGAKLSKRLKELAKPKSNKDMKDI